MDPLGESIPRHISEVERLTKQEGTTLSTESHGLTYELTRASIGMGYAYTLVEKKGDAVLATILLDDDLGIMPVSQCEPNNSLKAEPESVHMVVEWILNAIEKNQCG